MSTPTKGTAGAQNYLPMFSPDGTQLAFTSNRDGNPEIYVMNRRRSGFAAADQSSGHRHDADLVADRHADRLHVGARRRAVDLGGRRRRPRPAADDASSNSDRATWSPAPLNEIAYAARTGPGYDIKVLNLAASETRQITFGEGSNESPAWAPNGRHLAFTSTRAGRTQIFTVDRDGKNVRQITRDGNNQQPHWSQ